MSRRVVAILGTRYSDFAIEEAVLADLDVALVDGDGGDDDDVVGTAAGADVILAGSRPRFPDTVLRRLGCRGIVRYGIGTDTIDLAAAQRLGIAVARVSDYATEAVALHTVTMALALLRRLPEADRGIRRGDWGVTGLRPLHLPSTLQVGVVGYGRIGRQAAAHFGALGFRVVAYDEYVAIPADDDVASVSLPTLLEHSDVVSLHAPGRPDGSPLLAGGEFEAMKPGSVVVNTARGSLIDLGALVRGLDAGRPARAALDVFPSEPPDVSVFDAAADRVLLTPHMAWYTEESEADMRRKAAAEAARLLRGEPLADPVVEPGGQTP